MVASNGHLESSGRHGGSATPEAPGVAVVSQAPDSSIPTISVAGDPLSTAPGSGQSPEASCQLPSGDRALIAALTAPTADGDALLAKTDPLALGDWLERPDIRRALAAAEAVRDLRLRAKAAQRVEMAMDRLTAVLDAATDLEKPEHLTETRRASSTLLRLSTQYLYWSQHHAMRSPSTQDSGPRPQVRRGETQDFSTQHPARSTQHASRGSPPHLPTSPPPHRPLPPPPPPEPPILDTTSPAATVAGVLAALRTLPTPAPRAAAKLIERALAMSVRLWPLQHEHFLTGLQASPALAHRERPTRVEPVKVNGSAATQRAIYSLEGGAEAPCTFHLTRQDSDPTSYTSVSQWLLTAVTLDDTS